LLEFFLEKSSSESSHEVIAKSAFGS
jgi:hypothetical protein